MVGKARVAYVAATFATDEWFEPSDRAIALAGEAVETE